MCFIQNTKACLFIGGSYLVGNATIPLGTWTHIAFVRSGSTGSIYINSVLDKTGAVPSATLSSVGITISNKAGLGFGFRGQIADTRVWSVVRTQPQIYASMNVRLSGSEGGLLAYWPINDGTGTSVNELVANANGTLAGSPLPSWSFSNDLPVTTPDSIGAWTSASGGNWSDAANWLAGSVPNGDTHQACFTNQTVSALSITNDLSPLLLGSVILSSPLGCILTGNAFTFTNDTLPSIISVTGGTNALDSPADFGCNGLVVNTLTPSATTFGGVLSGSGGLVANPPSSGGGTITLAGANTYTGPTAINCGTLIVPSLADGGSASSIGASSPDASNLALGQGTFYYTGPSVTINRGYSLFGGSARATVMRLDNDLTIGGACTLSSGAFVKTGAGTLRYTYAGGDQTLANTEVGDGLLNIGSNGDGPTTGFFGYTIANGKVVMGVPGQTNTINVRITVGLYTTTSAVSETAGELQIDGGVLNCNSTLGIGRGNGTTVTAPDGLSSRLTVNGGLVACNILSVGFMGGAPAATFNARPVVDIDAGTVTVAYDIRFGESKGSVATLNLRGGTLQCASQTAGTGITLGGLSSNPSGTGILNLSGTGVLDIAQNVSLGTYLGGTGIVHLTGGTLIAGNMVRGAGIGSVQFNGGFFMPRTAGRTLSGLTAATVSTNGAVIDTSLASYTITQNLAHDDDLGTELDGGLVKLGTNTLTFATYGSTYTGPTVVSNGTLVIVGGLPADNALTVAADGEALIGGSATQTVAAATLVLDGTLGFALTLDGSAHDRLTVGTSPAIGVGSRIALYQLNTRLPFTRNGTYTLLTYSGADPAAANLSCANAAYGKTYTFAATGGNLTVTIGNDTSAASVWKTNGSGAWSTESNWWALPANAPGSQVRFDSAITAPATVTSAGETVGEIYLNNAVAYTLGGTGLTLDNTVSPALINIESGSHKITAPLTLNDDTTLNLSASTLLTLGAATGASATLTAQGNGTLALAAALSVQALSMNVAEIGVSNTLTLASPVALQRSITVRPALSTTATVSGVISGTANLTKVGSSTLALAAANTYSGVTTVSAGTLAANTLANGGTACSIGTASSSAANWVLGPATLYYTGPSATINRGYTLNAGSGRAAVLKIDNGLTIGGQCVSSSGAIIKTGPGTLCYTYANGGQTLAVDDGNTDALLNIGANGDSPTTGFSGYTISNGKVIMGAAGQTNTLNLHITAGLYTTTAAGAETAGELQIEGGVLNCNNTLGVGRGNGTTVTAPGGLSSRLTVNGGIVNCNILTVGYVGGAPAATFNARPVVDINAGTVTATSDIRFGESKGSVATLNLRGGTLRCASQTAGNGITFGGITSNPGGTGILNLSGTGVLDIVQNVSLGTYSGSTGVVYLMGGTLIASNIVRKAGSGYVSFNGGTFMPRVANQTLTGLTAATVSTNGAVFDTTLADGYTVAQNLLHDPALGSEDGGLVKLGANSLSLTGTGNAFNGPVAVRTGLLRARLSGTNDLYVATGAFFDALGDRCAVGDLTGNGRLTNGVIAVTARLDAGTNGAPAGAGMTVQNLTLAKGFTFACDWTNALGKVTNDFVTVTGDLSVEGAGYVDFGRAEANPTPVPFSTRIMSYGGSATGVFGGWKALNTGIPPGKKTALVVSAESGVINVEIRYSGLLFLIE